MDSVPEADALEQQEEVLPAEEPHLPPDIEAPEADALEQHDDVRPTGGHRSTDIEAPEADVLEQDQVVTGDDDDLHD